MMVAAAVLETASEIVRIVGLNLGERMGHNLIVSESYNSAANVTEDWVQNVRSLEELREQSLIKKVKFENELTHLIVNKTRKPNEDTYY